MPLITCSHCGASGNAPEHILGQQVRCSKCKQSFIATTDEPPPPVEAAISEAPQDEFGTGDEFAPPTADDRRRDDDDDMDRPRSIRRPASAAGLNFVDVITFRRMVAPFLIMVAFWIGLAAAILVSLFLMIMGVINNNLGAAFFGFLSLFFGPLLVRLWCEVTIVVFRINESLTDIRDELVRRRP